MSVLLPLCRRHDMVYPVETMSLFNEKSGAFAEREFTKKSSQKSISHMKLIVMNEDQIRR